MQYIISAATDNGVELVRECIARPVSFSSGWSKIRIGARIVMSDLSGNENLAGGNGVNTTNPGVQFAIGMCSGSANLLCDASTTHFVGVGSNPADTWTRESAETLWDFITYKGIVKVGTSTTYSSAVNGTNNQWGQGTSANWTPTPQMIFCDITKGSPNYTIGGFFITNGQVAGAQTSATFKSDMVLATPSEGGMTVASAPQTMAVDEGSNGTLNHVCISWNRTDFRPTIMDLAFVVLS